MPINNLTLHSGDVQNFNFERSESEFRTTLLCRFKIKAVSNLSDSSPFSLDELLLHAILHQFVQSAACQFLIRIAFIHSDPQAFLLQIGHVLIVSAILSWMNEIRSE